MALIRAGRFVLENIFDFVGLPGEEDVAGFRYSGAVTFVPKTVIRIPAFQVIPPLEISAELYIRSAR